VQVRWRCISRWHEIGVPFEGKPMSFKKNDMACLVLSPQRGRQGPYPPHRWRPSTEVAAILFYLARRFPDAGCLPRDDIEADAQALSWMSFATSTLHRGAPARTRLCQGCLGNCRPASGKRLGARPLFDRDIHLFRLYRLCAPLAESRTLAHSPHDGPLAAVLTNHSEVDIRSDYDLVIVVHRAGHPRDKRVIQYAQLYRFARRR